MLQLTRVLGLAIVAFAMLPGCSYLKDRGNDFLDMGGVELAFGPQTLINVRMTKALQVGTGFSQGDVVSWHGRRLAVFEENREEHGVGLGLGNAYFTSSERHVKVANSAYREFAELDEYKESTWDAEKTYDRSHTEIGFRIPLLCAGLGVHVDPGQMCDFLLGIFCIDFSRDDTKNQERKPVRMSPPLPDWMEFPEAEVK